MQPDHCLAHCAWLVGSQYKPAEVNKCGWDTVLQSPPWAVDAWGLGCFMQEAFSRQYMQSVENLRWVKRWRRWLANYTERGSLSLMHYVNDTVLINAPLPASCAGTHTAGRHPASLRLCWAIIRSYSAAHPQSA
jgi:hypothetical protein